MNEESHIRSYVLPADITPEEADEVTRMLSEEKSLLAVEAQVRLTEAGIEVNLRLGGNSARVIIDPSDNPARSYAFVSTLSETVMEAANRTTEKMMEHAEQADE